MKKILSLLFVLSLVACGGSDDEQEVSDGNFFLEHSGKFFNATETEYDSDESINSGFYISGRRRDIALFIFVDRQISDSDGNEIREQFCQITWIGDSNNGYSTINRNSVILDVTGAGDDRVYEINSSGRLQVRQISIANAVLIYERKVAGDFVFNCGNDMVGQ